MSTMLRLISLLAIGVMTVGCGTTDVARMLRPDPFPPNHQVGAIPVDADGQYVPGVVGFRLVLYTVDGQDIVPMPLPGSSMLGGQGDLGTFVPVQVPTQAEPRRPELENLVREATEATQGIRNDR